MGACQRLLIALSMLAYLSGWFPMSSGVENVYEMHPKYAQGSQHSMDLVSSLVERDTQRIGRRLQALSKTTYFPMQGGVHPEGIYYIKLYIGNPLKPYFIDVDTGSDLMWLQCDALPGKRAKGPHGLYTAKQPVSCKHPLCTAVQASSHETYDCERRDQQCDYDIEYVDHGSSDGILVKDIVVVSLTNKTSFGVHSVFGCGYNQDGSLAESPAKTDGVLGLGVGIASLPSQWSKQGLIKNVIGLCIAGGGKKGGYMFFGDEHLPTSSMTWVPMIGRQDMKHYGVGAAQMILGEKLLAKDGDGKLLKEIIFDSGSSYTYFTSQAYSALLSAVEENIGNQLEPNSLDRTLSKCWRGKKKFRSIADVSSYFETLTLNFGSTSCDSRSGKLEIHPEGYLIISAEGNVCLGILDGSELKAPNILGDISLQGYLMVLDNGNKRIGWARTDCTKTSRPVTQRQDLKDPSLPYSCPSTNSAEGSPRPTSPSQQKIISILLSPIIIIIIKLVFNQ